MLDLNNFLRAQKRRLAVLVLVLSLGAIVIGAHSGLSDTHGEGHLAETAAICLAIFTEAGLFVAAGAVLRHHRSRPAAPSRIYRVIPDPPVARARAGPLILQVFRL